MKALLLLIALSACTLVAASQGRRRSGVRRAWSAELPHEIVARNPIHGHYNLRSSSDRGTTTAATIKKWIEQGRIEDAMQAIIDKEMTLGAQKDGERGSIHRMKEMMFEGSLLQLDGIHYNVLLSPAASYLRDTYRRRRIPSRRLFHGTPTLENVRGVVTTGFDYATNNAFMVPGTYFTTSKDHAEGYAGPEGYVLECEVFGDVRPRPDGMIAHRLMPGQTVTSVGGSTVVVDNALVVFPVRIHKVVYVVEMDEDGIPTRPPMLTRGQRVERRPTATDLAPPTLSSMSSSPVFGSTVDSGVFGREDSSVFGREDSSVFGREDSAVFGKKTGTLVFGRKGSKDESSEDSEM